MLSWHGKNITAHVINVEDVKHPVANLAQLWNTFQCQVSTMEILALRRRDIYSGC